jgi:NADPH:quinone reductase
MTAAWYEKQGPANEVLIVGEMQDPRPGAGEGRIRIAAWGINPGDIKKRQDSFRLGMPYPRVIPHSDGAGVVYLVGDGVSAELVGRRAWYFDAQSYRPISSLGTRNELGWNPRRQDLIHDIIAGSYHPAHRKKEDEQ